MLETFLVCEEKKKKRDDRGRPYVSFEFNILNIYGRFYAVRVCMCICMRVHAVHERVRL